MKTYTNVLSWQELNLFFAKLLGYELDIPPLNIIQIRAGEEYIATLPACINPINFLPVANHQKQAIEKIHTEDSENTIYKSELGHLVTGIYGLEIFSLMVKKLNNGKQWELKFTPQQSGILLNCHA